jgi:hypothetical protein
MSDIDVMLGAPSPEEHIGAQRLQLIPKIEPEKITLWYPPFIIAPEIEPVGVSRW